MKRKDQIVLRKPDGSFSESVPVQVYNSFKENIISLFLFDSKLSETQIIEKLKNMDISELQDHDLLSSTQLVLLDMEASQYIEKTYIDGTIYYQLKTMFC